MIPFKSKLLRFKNIDKRNQAFNKLNLEEKRKEIAFEAFNLLIQKKIRASYIVEN